MHLCRYAGGHGVSLVLHIRHRVVQMIDYAPLNPRPRKPIMRDALLVVIASSGVAGLLYPFFFL